jgi:CYTH domain-containing protein
MATEIERKFRVIGDAWRQYAGSGKRYRQGYLSIEPERTVRVRTVNDEQGFVTIKGKAVGTRRSEFEFAIPYDDAEDMLDTLCLRPLIEKIRYRIAHAGLVWEVDEFTGDNDGLIVAEVELTDENQHIDMPDWVGKDVSDDSRYYNANLVACPFSQWHAAAVEGVRSAQAE